MFTIMIVFDTFIFLIKGQKGKKGHTGQKGARGPEVSRWAYTCFISALKALGYLEPKSYTDC